MISNSEVTTSAIKEACEIIEETVCKTFGPNGGLVLIDEKIRGKKPYLTKDGVTVAKNLSHKDPNVSAVLEIMLQACEETVKGAGDGTTTTSILMTTLISEYLAQKTTENNSFLVAHHLKEMLKTAKEFVKGKLKTPVIDFEQIEAVAQTSANGDASIATLVREAYEKVGVDGQRVYAPALGNPEVRETFGYNYHSGYSSKNFAKFRGDPFVRYKNPMVLIVSDIIGKDDSSKLEEFIDYSRKSGRPLVIVAEDFQKEVQAFILSANVREESPVISVRAYGYGEEREEFLEDLSVVTGGFNFHKLATKTFDQATLEDLGVCEQVHIGPAMTKFIGSSADPEDVEKHILSLKDFYKNETENFQKENLQKRIGLLESHTVFMNPGGQTEQELKERLHRLEDAFEACLTLRKDGIVPGGGLAYYRISQYLEETFEDTEDRDKLLAFKIFKKALLEPILRLYSVGLGSSGLLVDFIKDDDLWVGVDLKSKWPTIQKGSMEKLRIVDSTRTCIAALENSVSVFGTLISCSATVIKGV